MIEFGRYRMISLQNGHRSVPRSFGPHGRKSWPLPLSTGQMKAGRSCHLQPGSQDETAVVQLEWDTVIIMSSDYLVAHLSKWVISPVISGLTLLIPFITGVITHLLSGMSHQVITTLW